MKRLPICAFIAVACGLGMTGFSEAASSDAFSAAQQGDFETARRIWTEEATAGDPEAAFNLGYLYQNGDGVKQSYATALKWYEISAHAGLAQAQFQIGFMYAKGIGLDKDLHKAIIWTGMAAKQDHSAAKTNIVEMQEYLGTCYLSVCPKFDIPKDELKSYVWHSIAAGNGSEFSRGMVGALENLLSPAQLSSAKSIIPACKRSGYVSCD